MYFQGMVSLLVFGWMAEPTILTLRKKSPLRQLRALPSLLLLRATAALAEHVLWKWQVS